jgi:aspartyl-tRNA(Asn)/glutamyl-tRNA(Gln) amidotransferase subunit A
MNNINKNIFESLLSVDIFKKKIKNKEFSVIDLFHFFKNQMNTHSDLGGVISSFKEEDLMKEINSSQKNYDNNTERELEGIFITIKDQIFVKNIPATCSSKMLQDFIPVIDATVVENLKKHGAIITAKVNQDEFAMGSYGNNGFSGKTYNPFSKVHNKKIIAGGSSSGSAISVGAFMSYGSLGTDTGGSVRLPAAYCGGVGFKPTYGVLSRYGIVSYGTSLDTVGIIANSLEVCNKIFQCVRGQDEKDSTSVPFFPIKEISKNISSLKIGIIKNISSCDDCINESFNKVINFLKQSGATVEEVNIPEEDMALQVYCIISCTEAMSNLSRFDGIRYGLTISDINKESLNHLTGDSMLNQYYQYVRSAGFSEEVQKRILAGTFFSLEESNNKDVFLRQANVIRQIYCDFFYKTFETFDFLISPVTYSEALSEEKTKQQNPMEEYYSDLKTVFANLVGIPAMSLPIDLCSTHNLPRSIQIMGAPFSDDNIFRFANMINDHFEGIKTINTLLMRTLIKN